MLTDREFQIKYSDQNENWVHLGISYKSNREFIPSESEGPLLGEFLLSIIQLRLDLDRYDAELTAAGVSPDKYMLMLIGALSNITEEAIKDTKTGIQKLKGKV